MGTGLLVLLGCGVVANAVLAKNKGFGGGFLMINFGWGFAVMAGVYVAYKSGAHLNPAVTFGLLACGRLDLGAASTCIAYLLGEFAGAFIGAVLCGWPTATTSTTRSRSLAKLGTFSTGPAIRNTVYNLITEIIGTFVLVFVILAFGHDPDGARPAGRRASSWSVSVPRSVARPATPSTQLVTWRRGSRTSCCRSRARATATGPTPGSRSSARSSVA